MNRNIWNVSYPILLSSLAQNVINVIDTAFLGRVDEVELGAPAMGGLYYICAFTAAFGFSTGSQIVIGRKNGEERYDQIGPVMIQGVSSLLLLVAILFLFSRFFAGNMMRVLISPDTILNATGEFLDWRVSGFFFSFVSVMFWVLFIGITCTKVLTLSAVLMTVTNVLLDYLLTFGHAGSPRMGTQGAAIASVIAEAVSIPFFVVYMRPTVGIRKYVLSQICSFDFGLLERVLDISVFTMLQYFLFIATWFMFFIAVEHLGQQELVVANIVRSIYAVTLVPVSPLATTIDTSVSNSIGVGTINQVIPTTWKICKLSLGITVMLAAIVSLMPGWVVSIHANDASLVAAPVPSVYMIVGSLLIKSVANVASNGVSGTGSTRSVPFVEAAVLILYVLSVYVAGIRLRLSVAVCFLIEAIHYSGLLVTSVIYLKKASWRNKRI